MMNHGKWHWRCCWRPVVGHVLWVAAAASLVMAWVAVRQRGLVWGLEPLAWYWNALVLGVLAMGKKSHCGSCGMCGTEEKSGM